MWTERSHELDEYEEGAGDIIKHSRESLFLMGEVRVLDVLRYPIELLSFNISNGRFNAEKRELEKKLGFELDPTNRDHEEYFINLLLPNGEKSDLYIDLEKRGQIKPAIITNDGFLINANRRLACMKLANKKKPGKYSHMYAHRLDASIPPKEVYKLEVQLQVKNDFTEKYNPINEALMIKQGLEIMSKEEVMEVYGWKEKDFESYNRKLQLMDGFLQYIGEEGNYTKVFDLNEHFIEIEKELSAMKKMGINAIVRDKALDFFYAALKTNVESKGKNRVQRDRFRNVRVAFADDRIHKMLPENLVKLPIDEIYDNVIALTEVVRTKVANDKPVEHLKQALNHLNQISVYNEAILRDNFIEVFLQIKETIAEIDKVIGGEC